MQGRGIDVSLNETGRNQAEALAEYLQSKEIKHIFSSSLKRSKETADIIARRLELDYRSYPELDEMNFGILEGRPVNEIEQELDELHNIWKNGDVEFSSENGESPAMVYNRVSKRMEVILQEHYPDNLMFVLHGRLIRILLSQWLGYGLHAMHRIGHANGALYHLVWDGEIFKPVYVNNTEHLNGHRQK